MTAMTVADRASPARRPSIWGHLYFQVLVAIAQSDLEDVVLD